MADKCSITEFPEIWNLKREPRRPVELRKDYFNGMKFDENFDWNNLCYDAVQIDSGTILLIGPPLYGLTLFLTQNAQFYNLEDQPLSFNCIDIDRTGITVIHVNGWQKYLVLKPGNTVINVNKSDDIFNDKICLMTLQKDNPISWIQQWIAYHRDNLGVNGVVIYDNNSTQYSTAELEAAIQTNGVTVKVVEWNVPYGPQGFDCNHYNTWDSDYAQSSMFEHAKRRYLSSAKLAINCDIDELVVIQNGTINDIISSLDQEQLAGYCYLGRWIEPYDSANNTLASTVPLEERKFSDYYCTDTRNTIGIGNKWMIIPERSLNVQWSVHSSGAPMRQNTDIYYGHYMAMNTNWSWNREIFDRDNSGLIIQEQLKKNLEGTLK